MERFFHEGPWTRDTSSSFLRPLGSVKTRSHAADHLGGSFRLEDPVMFFPVVWGEIWDLVVEFSFVVSAEHGRQFTESWFDMFEPYMSAAKSDSNGPKRFASICQ